jgi:hypothetical protein
MPDTDGTGNEQDARATQDSAEPVTSESAEDDEAVPDEAVTEETAAEESAADGADQDAEHEDPAEERPGPRRGLVIALGAVAAVAVVALAVTALLTPGWLVNPGSPDDVAARTTLALAEKNPAELDAVSCRNQQGRSTNPFPPDALSLIQSARSAGPAHLELDTQARAPVDLTLAAQGQTQTLPADVVLGVTDGQWCMAGISERQ